MGAKQRRAERADTDNGDEQSQQDLVRRAAAIAAASKVTGRLRGAKGKVSGAAGDVSERVDDVTGIVQSAVSDTADRVQDAAAETVGDVSRKARKARKKARKAARKTDRKQQVLIGLTAVLIVFDAGVVAGLMISRKIAARKGS